MSNEAPNFSEINNDEEYYVVRTGRRSRGTSSRGPIKRLKKIFQYAVLIILGIIFLIFLLIILNNMGDKYKKKNFKKKEKVSVKKYINNRFTGIYSTEISLQNNNPLNLF